MTQTMFTCYLLDVHSSLFSHTQNRVKYFIQQIDHTHNEIDIYRTDRSFRRIQTSTAGIISN